MSQGTAPETLEQRLGLQRLNPVWAKLEIVLGLACIWVSFNVQSQEAIHNFGYSGEVSVAASAGLFVLGGYLAMAGSRSHLYQSANKLTAFVVQQIEGRK